MIEPTTTFEIKEFTYAERFDTRYIFASSPPSTLREGAKAPKPFCLNLFVPASKFGLSLANTSVWRRRRSKGKRGRGGEGEKKRVFPSSTSSFAFLLAAFGFAVGRGRVGVKSFA